jgi:hypothetical protein
MENLTFYEKIKDLCYVRRVMPEVITRRESIQGEDWVIIYDDLQQKLYKLKGNAAAIWDKLTGENTVDMIIEQLCSETGKDREFIIKDVCKFISKVGKKGLIKAAVRTVASMKT